MKLRIHLLGLPNAALARKYSLDGFSQAGLRFAKVLKELGHHVILYTSEPEENEAPCDELVTVITSEERDSLLKYTKNPHTGLIEQTPYQYAYIEEWSPIWQLANARMVDRIAERKQPRDIICTIGGQSQRPVADAHSDLMTVEYSIGYHGSFSKYRVFESEAWKHCTYGFQNITDGRFFDTVIPIPFDPDEYPFVPHRDRENFMLYCGRLIPRKGLDVVAAVAKAANIPLKIIGHGASPIPEGAEYLGAVDDKTRNLWMSRAMVGITPTIYLEPFNQATVEMQLCGTPVLTTDWGGFTETVEQHKTGFRCNYLGEFVEGVRMARQLDNQYIRERAVRLYSMHRLKYDYQRYFERIMLLWDEGWNTVHDYQRDLTEELTRV